MIKLTIQYVLLVKVVTRRDVAWRNRVSLEMDGLGLSLCAVPSRNHLSYISEKSCQRCLESWRSSEVMTGTRVPDWETEMENRG
jgi:hypothetical protein